MGLELTQTHAPRPVGSRYSYQLVAVLKLEGLDKLLACDIAAARGVAARLGAGVMIPAAGVAVLALGAGAWVAWLGAAVAQGFAWVLA